MNCKKCGATLSKNDKFCKSCGEETEKNKDTNNNFQPMQNQDVNNNFQPEMNNNFQNQNMNGFQPEMNNNFQNQNMNGFQPMQQPMNNFQPNMNNYQQPSWASGYTAPNYQVQSGGGYLKYILIGLGVIVAILLAVFLIGGKKSEGGGLLSSNPTTDVKFNNFTFKIPTDMVYEVQYDSLAIGNSEDTWAAIIEVVEGSYSELVSNKSKLKSYFENLGYNSSAANEKTVSGLKLIEIELSMNGENVLGAYAEANHSNVFAITLYNKDNEFDHNALKKIASILKKAEYSSQSNSISVMDPIDLDPIYEFAN